MQRSGLNRPVAKTDVEGNASRKFLLPTAALALATVVGVGSARAQETRVIGHIPFTFRVGTSTLPVGDYTLERQGQGQHVWLIRNDQT